jgi:hypothetical protein
VAANEQDRGRCEPLHHPSHPDDRPFRASPSFGRSAVRHPLHPRPSARSTARTRGTISQVSSESSGFPSFVPVDVPYSAPVSFVGSPFLSVIARCYRRRASEARPENFVPRVQDRPVWIRDSLGHYRDTVEHREERPLSRVVTSIRRPVPSRTCCDEFASRVRRAILTDVGRDLAGPVAIEVGCSMRIPLSIASGSSRPSVAANPHHPSICTFVKYRPSVNPGGDG